MKLLIVLATLTLAQAAKLDRAYLPPTSRGSAAPIQAPYSPAVRSQASRERNAAILRQDYSNNGGVYSYAYETENGISGEEQGVATNGVQAQGRYSYTGDDGKVYSVWYTADENGFVPQGDHLPTPPPIPEAILRALEQNARDEAAGIFDDGSYTETKPVNRGPQRYFNTRTQPAGYSRHSSSVSKTYLPPHAETVTTVAEAEGY